MDKIDQQLVLFITNLHKARGDNTVNYDIPPSDKVNSPNPALELKDSLKEERTLKEEILKTMIADKTSFDDLVRKYNISTEDICSLTEGVSKHLLVAAKDIGHNR